MSRTDAQKEANRKYYGTKYKQISFKLNKVTDREIIEHLDKIDNIRGYLINLIKADISNTLLNDLLLDIEFLEDDTLFDE